MTNQSYIRVLTALELFSKEHLQVKRFASDFPEQLPNFSSETEQYPILFVSPTNSIFKRNQNTFELIIYCYDLIQDGRDNINTILSDTNTILNDLYLWLRDGDVGGLEVLNDINCTPINNTLLDYVAGWQMNLTIEADTYNVCEIPFNDEPSVLDVVNNIIYSKYLTCETLSDCSTIIDIENNLSGLTDDLNGLDDRIVDLETDVDDINNTLLKKQDLNTGYINGLILSINSEDNTKFDISSGGYVVKDTQVNLIVYDGIQGITPNYLTTSNITYIGLDEDQDIVQKTSPFTNEERRNICMIGAVIHSNRININVVNQIKAPILNDVNQLHDFIKAVGTLNLDGNTYSANGTNLNIDKTSGVVFGLGINSLDETNPHQITIPEQNNITFRYRLQNGTEYSDTNLIDPTHYDNNGVLTPLLNNNIWSVQHINLFQSGLTSSQYGQHQYNSLEEAESKLKTDTFVTESNISENAIFRSYLIIKKDCTNLSDTTKCKFIPVDKWGNVISGSVSLTFQTIIDALGYTPEDVSNKTDVIGTGNTTNYPSTKGVVDYITSSNATWKKSGLVNNANLVNEKIYRQNSVNLIGSTVNFGTGPTQADIDGEVLGSQFGHIFGGGTVPFIQLLGNGANGSAGPNQFISRVVGASKSLQQMTFSTIKSTNYDAWGDAGRLLWRFQDGYLSPQAKFDIGTDYLRLHSYTSSRNDTGDTMSNVLFTTSNGSLRSKQVTETPFVNKFIQVNGVTISSSGWTLNAGFYEYVYSNVNITSNSIVDVVPDNSSFSIVSSAQLLPRVDSSTGSIKIYSNNLPSGNFDVTIIINKN